MVKILRSKLIMTMLILWIVSKSLFTIFAEKVVLEKDESPMEKKELQVKGVIDRMEDHKIVILVEDLREEFIILQDDYEAPLQPHMWVELALLDGQIKELSIDWEKSRQEREKVKELLNTIREKETTSIIN